MRESVRLSPHPRVWDCPHVFPTFQSSEVARMTSLNALRMFKNGADEEKAEVRHGNIDASFIGSHFKA